MAVASIPHTPSYFSVNRVRVVDLPGIKMDSGVRGQLAYHLASVLAMTWFARERAADLRLPEAFFDDGPSTRSDLPRFIDASLNSVDERARAAAHAVATRVGRNLGHVLVALHRGDRVNRDARSDWTDEEWQRWSLVRRVVLAGGLMSGRLGAVILDSAREWLVAAGYGAVISVEASPYGGMTSLLGAARHLPPGAGDALCCDFGQTSAKRAILTVERGDVVRVDRLPALYLEGAWHLHPDDDRARAGHKHKAFVVDAICDALARAGSQGRSIGPDIMVCVAAYVDGGRLLGNGAYATMMELAPDVRPLLAGAITERTGRCYRLHPIHDGTAAAAIYAGQTGTAVIALGTALGVGFAPATAEGLLTLEAA